jgi:hypothetical protein
MRFLMALFLCLVACNTPTPQVFLVEPRIARVGEIVRVRGSNLPTGSSIQIGSVNASIVSSSSSEIAVQMPTLPIGEYDLRIVGSGIDQSLPGPAILGADDTDVVAREVLATGTFSRSELEALALNSGFVVLSFHSTSLGSLPSCNRNFASLRDTQNRSTSAAINDLQTALHALNPSYEANPRSILAGSQVYSQVYSQAYSQAHIARPQPQNLPIPIPAPSDVNLANIKVAVLDSGVSSHPSLATLQAGHNLTNFDNPADPRAIQNDVSDLGIYANTPMGHGTGVAALIAGSSLGLGTGYAVGVPILPIKVCQTTQGKNRCDGLDVVLGICQAVDNGANIINLSLGGRQPFRALKQVLLETSSRGISVVAAAGNSGLEANPSANYPAAYALEVPGLIAVAATEQNGADWVGSGYSTPGAYVTIAAPGANQTATVTDSGIGGYGLAVLEGTSFATPIVSAAVARVKAKDPTKTPSQIKAHLENTAQTIVCTKNKCGAGLLDIGKAAQ